MRSLAVALALHALLWLVSPTRSLPQVRLPDAPIELELAVSPPRRTPPLTLPAARASASPSALPSHALPSHALPSPSASMPPHGLPPPRAAAPPPALTRPKLAAMTPRPPAPSSLPLSRAHGDRADRSGTTGAFAPVDAAGPPAARAPVDLFSRDALGAAIGRPGAGAGAGASADRPAAGLLADAPGRERARAGQVDPAWRDVERAIDAGFHPTFAQVTSRSAGALLLAQLRAGFPHADALGPSDRRHLVATGAAGDWFELDGMLRKIRSRFSAAAESRRTEVELLVDASGALIDLRIASPSGRARFDAMALEAVRQAVAGRPPRVGTGRTRARFLVAAAVSVAPPEVMTSADPGGGQPAAALNLLSLKFDEASGKLPDYDHALRQHVTTEVTLSYLAPAD